MEHLENEKHNNNAVSENGNRSDQSNVLPVKDLSIPSPDLFVKRETKDVNEIPKVAKVGYTKEKTYRERIFEYLGESRESDGYRDALLNPEYNYCSENLSLICKQMTVLLSEAYHAYTDYLNQLNHQIQVMQSKDLRDYQSQLEMRKQEVLSNIELVNKLFKEFEKLSQRDLLETVKKSSGKMPDTETLSDNSATILYVLGTYYRGFERGYIAITTTNLINKKI